MNDDPLHDRTTQEGVHSEFDWLADNYRDQHAENVAISGEGPEYFAEYKIADLARWAAKRQLPDTQILDFGSGIGNSVPCFRRYFESSKLTCCDVSARSIEIARSRFGGLEKYLRIDGNIPLGECSQDIVFSACVFHHIPHEEHRYWLTELRRVTRPGGVLVVYEHNPMNPLTVRAVNTCPLDANARLIGGRTMRQRVLESGWEDASIEYKLFFPGPLRLLRGLESRLGWCGFGAQYRMTARRPA